MKRRRGGGEEGVEEGRRGKEDGVEEGGERMK